MAQMPSPDPIWTNCPNCNTEILTTTEKSNSTLQMLVAGGFCLFAGVSSILSIFCVGFPLCFCIPFCMDDWKDVLHTCPNCNYGIGKFKRLWSNQKRNYLKKLLPYLLTINHFSIREFLHWIKYCIQHIILFYFIKVIIHNALRIVFIRKLSTGIQVKAEFYSVCCLLSLEWTVKLSTFFKILTGLRNCCL